VDAFNNAAQAQASRLRDLAQQLDASRAGVIEQALHERLQPAPPKMPDKRNGRM
jgi:hypothetical protein